MTESILAMPCPWPPCRMLPCGIAPLFTALMLRLLLERPNKSSERILREREMRFAPGHVHVRSSGRSSHLPAHSHSYSWPLRSTGLGPAACARRRAAAASALLTATERQAEDRPAGIARRRWARLRTVARAARSFSSDAPAAARSFVVQAGRRLCEPGGGEQANTTVAYRR